MPFVWLSFLGDSRRVACHLEGGNRGGGQMVAAVREILVGATVANWGRLACPDGVCSRKSGLGVIGHGKGLVVPGQRLDWDFLTGL